MKGERERQDNSEERPPITLPRSDCLSHVPFLTLLDAFYQIVQAPRTSTGSNQPKVDEAEDHGFFATVVDRPKTARRPTAEIGYRHFAAQDECRWPGEEAEDHQQPASNFQRSGQAVKCPEIVVHSS